MSDTGSIPKRSATYPSLLLFLTSSSILLRPKSLFFLSKLNKSVVSIPVSVGLISVSVFILRIVFPSIPLSLVEWIANQSNICCESFMLIGSAASLVNADFMSEHEQSLAPRVQLQHSGTSRLLPFHELLLQ